MLNVPETVTLSPSACVVFFWSITMMHLASQSWYAATVPISVLLVWKCATLPATVTALPSYDDGLARMVEGVKLAAAATPTVPRARDTVSQAERIMRSSSKHVQ